MGSDDGVVDSASNRESVRVSCLFVGVSFAANLMSVIVCKEGCCIEYDEERRGRVICERIPLVLHLYTSAPPLLSLLHHQLPI